LRWDESSTALHCPNRYQRLNPILRQPGSCRSSCLPLTFIPLHEAEDTYATKFSWVLSFGSRKGSGTHAQ
jgi:hypothetical protein